jgi:hypothetical protein
MNHLYDDDNRNVPCDLIANESVGLIQPAEKE